MARENDFFVTVDGERGETFRQVLGTNRVAVQSPVPFRANLPGREGELVYLLDVKSLTADQRKRLVTHLSIVFNLPGDEVERDLDRDGMPILAESCSVAIHNVQRWV